MARAALNWGVRELARAANVGVNTISSFETGNRKPIPATLAAIQRALEEAGVEFISENGGGPGVRLRESEPAAPEPAKSVRGQRLPRGEG